MKLLVTDALWNALSRCCRLHQRRFRFSRTGKRLDYRKILTGIPLCTAPQDRHRLRKGSPAKALGAAQLASRTALQEYRR